MAEGSEKREALVYAIQDSGTGPPSLDSQPPWTAHLVLEQFERHVVANGKIIERRAFAHVAAVEKHFTIVRQPDETVTLTDEEHDNSSRTWSAAAFSRWNGRGLSSGCFLADRPSSVPGHAVTSAAPSAGGERCRRRRSRRSARPSDGLH